MRDTRSIITEKVMMTLVKHGVSTEIISEAQTQLEIELAKCEVYERCTEIATIDSTPFQYLQQFLNTKKIEGKSEGTINRYKYEIEKLLWYYHKPLNEFTTNDLRVYLEYRKKTGTYKKELSNRTLDGMRKCYSSFFKWLTAEKIIPWNPCLSLHKIRYKKTVRKTYTSVEMQKMREACETDRDTAIVDWFASTGCRVGEVSTTSIGDIDWNDKSVIVTGKGDKERQVYFDDVTAMHLQQYLVNRKDSCTALFVGRNGDPLSVSGIQQAVKKIGERAGVEKAHCHRFRHTLATYLVTKMPITEVASILGHEDISTTQIYITNSRENAKANYKLAMGA